MNKLFATCLLLCAVLATGCTSLNKLSSPPLPDRPVMAGGLKFEPDRVGCESYQTCFKYGNYSYFVLIDRFGVPRNKWGRSQDELDRELVNTLNKSPAFSMYTDVKLTENGFVTALLNQSPVVLKNRLASKNGKKISVSVGKLNSKPTPEVAKQIEQICNDFIRLVENSD